MNRFRFIFILLLLTAFQLKAQKPPFSKGVNITNWFQAGSAQEIQFTKYTQQDFADIKSLGCDVIRLPINLHYMTNGAPDYTLDPLFLTFLDEVVSWTENLGLHLILDNHTFSVDDDTDPNVGDILTKVWPQMAEHFLETSMLIYFEIMNEPHGIDDATWNSIQQETVAAIRQVDTKHTIIVGPAEWNSFNNLEKMPIYTDDNLIYTFHFYDPFLFTHQGASWTGMTEISDIPFPYSAENMPEFPDALKTHWSYNSYKDYKNTGTIEEVHQLIDKAIAFQQERNVPIYCGEFGVFDQNSPDEDRTKWYGIVSDYLSANNIGWTIWDYHGGFGIYEKGSGGMFKHDLNVPVCEALGFTPPEQTDFIAMPDSVGFEIFGDYPGKNISISSGSSGNATFYSTNQVNNGNNCIEWSNASQYETLAFDFKPDKDLSILKQNNYALDLFIRGTDPDGSIDIRFVDSDTGEDDHPWRNRITINKSLIEWSGKWEHLHIPLKQFKEQGAWEGSWFNPEGVFDWTAIDQLQIVAETKAMGPNTIWLDNIYISNLDTAKVYNTEIPIIEEPEEESSGFNIYTDQTSSEITNVENTTGQFSYSSVNYPANGDYCIEWTDAERYQSLDFRFNETKNLNQLANNEYALDLFVRSGIENLAFDLRFVDTKKGADDHPWRMGTTIDSDLVEWNDEWQHLHIPLNSMNEQGSYDEQWFEANNLFDWKAVDQIQIATEHMAFNGKTLFLDDIIITNRDTASVHNFRDAVNKQNIKTDLFTFRFDAGNQKLMLANQSLAEIKYRIINLSGKIISSGTFDQNLQIHTASFQNGIYLIQATNNKKFQSEKVLIH